MATDPELYVTLIPCTKYDHERIFRTRSGPHQRIKVSQNSRLTTIAQYVLGLAPSSRGNRPSHISFYAKRGGDHVSLPLCLTLGELFLITNQPRDGELFFSLTEEFVGEVEPMIEKAADIPVGEVEPSPVFHSGLSLLSNSFGMILPNMDSRGDSGGQKGEEGGGETPLDLRNHLEALLAGQPI
jgi:hypothetical protein